MTWTEDELEAWIGRHAVDAAGERIGKVVDVYMDDATGEPEWLAVTTGLFGTRISFVPLAGASRSGDDVLVAYAKGLVKESPNTEADGELSLQEEERLYRHYGLNYSQRSRSDTTVGAQVDPELVEAGSASINHEVSAETARLRLRRREAQALEDIDLSADDEDDEIGVETLTDRP